jgi:hypothetical protein
MLILIYWLGAYILLGKTRSLIAAKEIGLKVNAEKTKYMVVSRDQNAGQNGNIRIGNKSFETVEQFKYLGTTLGNKNSVYEKIKGRLKSRHACYHLVQNIFFVVIYYPKM